MPTMTPNELYRWLAKLVSTLPSTKVTITWGEPHFRVGEKIFSGWGQGKDGRYSVGIKLDKDKQAALVASDPRFEVAPYVGKHGWASFFPGEDPDLAELEALVVESYCNIAPRALAAKARAAQLPPSGRTARTAGGARATAGAGAKSKAARGAKAKPARPRPGAAKAKPARPKPGGAKGTGAAGAKSKAARAAKAKPVRASKTKRARGPALG